MLTPKDELVSRFEAAFRERHISLRQFVSECEQAIPSEKQLLLFSRDIRLRLLRGDLPTAKDYEKLFPHFISLFNSLLLAELMQVVKEANPVEDNFGGLTCNVGDYEVMEQSGRDAGSVSYNAFQASLERKVKLRVLHFPTETEIDRAKRIALLDHPNLEGLIDVVPVGDTSMVVSQLEYGDSLATLLANPHAQVSQTKIANWIRAIADALRLMHQFDLPHLNVSPGNILVRDDDHVVLLNPALSNWVDQYDSVLPKPNELVEFPYRSFAEAAGGMSSTQKDTVALGILMFQLVTWMPLEGFHSTAPMPEESKRLGKVIADQLDYHSADIDLTLAERCRRSTLGAMQELNPIGLNEFCETLDEWIASHSFGQEETGSDTQFLDKAVEQQLTSGNSGAKSFIDSVARGLRWLGERSKRNAK